MPLCTLHLFSLTSSTTIPSFLSSLRSASLIPIIQSKVVRWIILPKALSTVPLLAHNIHWDLLILLPDTSRLPATITSQLVAEWHVTVGVPSRLLKDFSTMNTSLLNPSPGTVKAAEKPDETPAQSMQNLELTPELASWIESLPTAQRNHPISMLNLLSFVPGKKEQYLTYGAAFAKSIGSRHGGAAKIVGNVIHHSRKAELGASADEAAAAGYMVPHETMNRPSGRSENSGASASAPSASGLMVEDEAAGTGTKSSITNVDRTKPDIMKNGKSASATGAQTAGYMIPNEATDSKNNPHSSHPVHGASASAAPSSGLMIESEPSTSTSMSASHPKNISQDHGKEWDEIAIAHYPSLYHFAAMAGSKDYQEVNKKFRVGSLRDTFILCTMEIDEKGELAGGNGNGVSKL